MNALKLDVACCGYVRHSLSPYLLSPCPPVLRSLLTPPSKPLYGISFPARDMLTWLGIWDGRTLISYDVTCATGRNFRNHDFGTYVTFVCLADCSFGRLFALLCFALFCFALLACLSDFEQFRGFALFFLLFSLDVEDEDGRRPWRRRCRGEKILQLSRWMEGCREGGGGEGVPVSFGTRVIKQARE